MKIAIALIKLNQRCKNVLFFILYRHCYSSLLMSALIHSFLLDCMTILGTSSMAIVVILSYHLDSGYPFIVVLRISAAAILGQRNLLATSRCVRLKSNAIDVCECDSDAN